jgi:hypothetical protein
MKYFIKLSHLELEFTLKIHEYKSFFGYILPKLFYFISV